jgi:hypothetical protein
MRENNSLFAGLVIPAHIFVYSTNATIAAISYIKKPFFIDPMTYILSMDGIADYVTLDKETSKRKFKPSISKLVTSYGLFEHFQKTNYAPLTIADFSDAFINDLVNRSLELQLNKLDSEKGNAVDKYLEILKELGETHIDDFLNQSQKPQFVTAPYFYFDNKKSDWLDVNIKIAEKTREIYKAEVVPILLTKASCLSKELLDKYSTFQQIIIWVTDLNEKDTSDYNKLVSGLKKIKSFVEYAKSMNISVFNLYGGYFSALLTKSGLSNFSHGIFYGEYKSMNTTIGGIPPSRYYIKKLHEFFSTPEASKILELPDCRELLDRGCKKAMEIINDDVSNIVKLADNPRLAQKHFLITRRCELDDVENKTMNQLKEELVSAYDKYLRHVTHVTKKKIEYLKAWAEALE